MAATLALPEDVVQGSQGKRKNHTESIPPMIRNLLQDLSKIRMAILTESPQSLPLVAPLLIETEVHLRQLWQAQP
jgi:hypothetical protein